MSIFQSSNDVTLQFNEEDSDAYDWENFEKMLINDGRVKPEAYMYLTFDAEHPANGYYRLTACYEKILEEENNIQGLATDITNSREISSSRFFIQQHPLDRNFFIISC
jgi:hypothetical protein